jgi:hypothetical protein
VDEVPIAGRDDPGHLVRQFLANYDAPAYVRRARAVQDAVEALFARCRRQRDEWLEMVRLRLGMLKALAGEWDMLRPWLAEAEQLSYLSALADELNPHLRVPVAPTTSDRVLARAFRELSESIERFNRRWLEYLPTVDLGPVNELRDGYNRHYILEKECAVRSPRLARQGYKRLAPLTVDDLLAAFPPLAVPRLRT